MALLLPGNICDRAPQDLHIYGLLILFHRSLHRPYSPGLIHGALLVSTSAFSFFLYGGFVFGLNKLPALFRIELRKKCIVPSDDLINDGLETAFKLRPNL